MDIPLHRSITDTTIIAPISAVFSTQAPTNNRIGVKQRLAASIRRVGHAEGQGGEVEDGHDATETAVARSAKCYHGDIATLRLRLLLVLSGLLLRSPLLMLSLLRAPWSRSSPGTCPWP